MLSLYKSVGFAGFAAALACAVASSPASAIQENAKPTEAGAQVHPSVIVFDQKLDGSIVKLAYAYVPKKSFVVIYGSDKDGRLSGSPLGSLALEPGDHRDIKVNLTTPAKAGEKLWVSLSHNSGTAKSVEKSDVSYWAQNELPLANSFRVQ